MNAVIPIRIDAAGCSEPTIRAIPPRLIKDFANPRFAPKKANARCFAA